MVKIDTSLPDMWTVDVDRASVPYFFFARRTSVAALISDSLSACRAATDRYGVLTPFCIGGMFGAMFGAMFGDATKGETLKMEPSGGEAFAAAPSAVVGLLAAGRTGES